VVPSNFGRVASVIPNSRFRLYLRELRHLTREAVDAGGLPHSGIELAHGHLDGRASRELRSAVALTELRRIGAFFTGEALARQLLGRAQPPSEWRRVLDPACGCGDLLLAAARRLEVTDDLGETLKTWGAVAWVPQLVLRTAARKVRFCRRNVVFRRVEACI